MGGHAPSTTSPNPSRRLKALRARGGVRVGARSKELCTRRRTSDVLQNRPASGRCGLQAAQALVRWRQSRFRAIAALLAQRPADRDQTDVRVGSGADQVGAHSKAAQREQLKRSMYELIDPAPPLAQEDAKIDELKTSLNDQAQPLFERYRAMFQARELGTDEACLALASGFGDSLALFKHGLPTCSGSSARPVTVPSLIKVLGTRWRPAWCATRPPGRAASPPGVLARVAGLCPATRRCCESRSWRWTCTRIMAAGCAAGRMLYTGSVVGSEARYRSWCKCRDTMAPRRPTGAATCGTHLLVAAFGALLFDGGALVDSSCFSDVLTTGRFRGLREASGRLRHHAERSVKAAHCTPGTPPRPRSPPSPTGFCRTRCRRSTTQP